jgi:hypothetical protein
VEDRHLTDSIEYILDSAYPREKRENLVKLGALQGRWKITGERDTGKMSDRARGYYFGVVCKSLMLYVAEQGEHMTKDQAHAKFKEKFLPPTTFTNHATGEEETIPPTLTNLDTPAGSIFIEKCIVWLSEMGVVVPEPTYHRKSA